METAEKKDAIKGGEFLIRETEAANVFIPEEFSEEQKMMAQATQDFIDHEIKPVAERLEKGEYDLGGDLLKKAGELGLLGISIPEEYGGLGMNFNTSLLIADILGSAGSFSTTYGAHTGIGTLPILYYGTEEQKQKYLPKLASGEWIGCYCLTEPDAGSDANSGKTKAVLTDDGKYYSITGQKMWISNAGYADLLIVFAKIDDDEKLSAFIVERTAEGITMNDEELKLGIKGSSTRQVFFNDCKIPKENLLSERENGFKIAVNILNIGRIKLGAGGIGGMKEVITLSTNYANERKQFGQSISNFGAIKQKLATMATKTYVTESLNYRAGQNIDDRIDALKAKGVDDSEAKLRGIAQFAIECSISKVHGSEVLSYIVDEAVQIYGGMGFSEDAPMARAYRDARITRIYEGTNEINRMLMIDMILKRAMKGELDLMKPAEEVANELTSIPDFSVPDDTKLFDAEKRVLRNLKKAGLMVAGGAVRKLMMKISDEQEILMNMADMLTEIYAAESTILRTEKLVGLWGEEACQTQIDMSVINLHHAVNVINNAGKEAIYAFAEGDELRVMLLGLKRFTKIDPFNLKEARRRVADKLIENNGYAF
ncbi:acyl-CoA dehydrogenase family protein [Fulvivirgaceae bacterium BMA10]|uniref:Acyl-CoA dehydrogenase family protein n=1 Tax=Splendidivirga corallicola TaxID=3051826 RepID=A0ABT8KMX7_9BACT|nr:acyl-CoA dehydrogenase family protein [Fulvivirgaceae bacterium BMA10]